MPVRRPVPAALLAAAAVALSSCANPLAEDAVFARQALVGMPRADLLACAGAPDSSFAADGREFFTYQSESVSGFGPQTSIGVSRGWWGSGVGTGIGLGFPLGGGGEIRRSACRATFVLDGGRVAEVNYADPQGNADIGQCGRIVRSCLERRPAPGAAGTATPAFPPLPDPAPVPVPRS